MKKVWEDAGNPDLVDSNLRYEEQDAVGRSVWEFVGRFPSPIVIHQWTEKSLDTALSPVAGDVGAGQR